jgi:hypothetical protein
VPWPRVGSEARDEEYALAARCVGGSVKLAGHIIN